MVGHLFSAVLRCTTHSHPDSRRRSPQPVSRAREQETQAQASRPVPQLLLHGRQVSRSVHSPLLLSRPVDVQPGCFSITTVFSHAQTVVVCAACTSVLCQPTGGKARLTEGTAHPPLEPVSLTHEARRMLVSSEKLSSCPSIASHRIALQCSLSLACMALALEKAFRVMV